MNKLVKIVAACAVILSLSACGNAKEICGKTYDTYGIFQTESEHNENIRYRVIPGNVIWSVVLIESVVFPVYFVGFSIYEPVDSKVPCEELNKHSTK